MIKIQRVSAPSELNDETVSTLTTLYKSTGENVWNKPYIKKELLKMSHNKCCYCELKLGEEGKYMQVEHYHCKSLYPDEVVLWENLLPSCNRCNTNKSSHDTKKEPIINPCCDNPSDYLYMENYRLKSKDNNLIGCTTIDVLYLNESDSLVLPRFNIGNKIQEKLQFLEDLLIDYIDGNNSTRRRNRIINGLKDLLSLADPTKEYSATAATVIITDGTYQLMQKQLARLSLWADDLQYLHDNAVKNSLCKNEI